MIDKWKKGPCCEAFTNFHTANIFKVLKYFPESLIAEFGRNVPK
jgi:hypothetical protein